MNFKRKIVLVTGSNKGIGYGIIEILLQKKSNLRIILTSRNEDLGKKSFYKLLTKYPYSKDYFYYHQLDITNKESISNLISWLKKQFGKIDYLVNNAGYGPYASIREIDVHMSVLEINVFGTINFTEEMIKNNMINKKGKIICVGSMGGCLHYLNNNKLKNDFKNARTTQDLLNLAQSFKNSFLKGTQKKDGWCNKSYYVSKMIINSYPRILSYRREIENNDISVYSIHPGWVKTDMGGSYAPLTYKQGAECEVFLIELPDGINRQYQGKFFNRFTVSSFE